MIVLVIVVVACFIFLTAISLFCARPGPEEESMHKQNELMRRALKRANDENKK